jgi:hypothetical protein
MPPLAPFYRFLALGCIAVLAACVNQLTSVATFQTQDGTISLQQAANGGAFSVSIGPRTVLPLEAYTTAHVDSIWNLPGERLVVITGAGTDCRMRYTLVIAEHDGGSLHTIGECGDSLDFVQEGNTVAIRQVGVRNPKTWTVSNGSLSGPTVQTAVRAPRPAPDATPPRSAEAASDATAPPVVSAPVGDEVIPAPVGSPAASRGRP